MVKNKKMSKSSIAIIVLALLLVLSMVMGLTGAWFTASKTDNDTANVLLRFGEVAYNLDVETRVFNDVEGTGHTNLQYDAGEDAQMESGKYVLVAGTLIYTKVEITNTSDIDTWYVLVQVKNDGVNNAAKEHYYYVDKTADRLVEITSALDATNSKLEGRISHAGGTPESVSFDALYRVDPAAYQSVDAGNATAKDEIFQKYGTDNWEQQHVVASDGYYTYGNAKLVYGSDVSLGLLLVEGTYEVRAIQVTNLTAPQAWSALTEGWNGTTKTGAPVTTPQEP